MLLNYPHKTRTMFPIFIEVTEPREVCDLFKVVLLVNVGFKKLLKQKIIFYYMMGTALIKHRITVHLLYANLINKPRSLSCRTGAREAASMKRKYF